MWEKTSQPRILCVSIYDELGEMVTNYAQQYGVTVDIYKGGIYNNGHIHALENQDKYDVIISQAGTALAIQRMVKIPVVSIQITAKDIIEIMQEAWNAHKEVLCINYESDISKDIDAIASLSCKGSFHQIVYRSSSEFNSIIENLGNYTHDVGVIGFGGCVVQKADEYGLPYYLVRSSGENIRQAVLAARNITEQHIKEKARARRLNNIINYSIGGILSVGSNNTVTICNLPAKQMLKLTGRKVLGTDINAPDAPPEIRMFLEDGDYTVDKLVSCSGKSYVMNRVPIRVRDHHQETIITFQELSKIQKTEVQARIQLAHKGLVAKYQFRDIVCAEGEMTEMLAEAKRFAKGDASILIEGESGTGKELLAQSIHNSSNRKKGPFVAVNCAALPEQLLESELFGYDEGAFTGARKGGKAGMFEMAHKGTLFLDEISEMTQANQVRLLRALQEKEIFRVGGDRVVNIDVRIIAASNRDLFRMASEGLFRRDLYFRLNILPLHIPPLRERKDNIPLLIAHFAAKRRRFDIAKKAKKFPPAVLEALNQHNWPGNVRELENVLDRIFTLDDGSEPFEDLLLRIITRHRQWQHARQRQTTAPDGSLTVPLGSMAAMERYILEAELQRYNGNKKALADALGISRVTVWKKFKEYGQQETAATPDARA